MITVRNSDGKIIANKEPLIFKKADGVGGEIGLRLFGKGGAVAFEPPAKPEFKNDQLKK